MSKRQTKLWSLVFMVLLLACLPGLVGCGGDKDGDKDKIDYLVFQDPSFQFQLIRAIGATLSYGADIMECLSTAYAITEGDFESWYQEWHKTAERVHNIADEALAKGHKVSAYQAYLRATTYYRCAEFYLHGNPDDPRILATWGASRECFRQAAPLLPTPVEVVEIPYENTTLPGYFLQVDDSGVARPTVIVQTGFDGTGEELYFGVAASALQRGYNCLIFEGPGQGSVVRVQKLYFRPDWEKVVTPVVDYALTRPEIEPSRMALIGISLGGYLAPRAACYEHRIAACIADGGVFDAFMGAMGGPESRDEVIEYCKEDPEAFNEDIMKDAESDTGLRWAIDNGMFTFCRHSRAKPIHPRIPRSRPAVLSSFGFSLHFSPQVPPSARVGSGPRMARAPRSCPSQLTQEPRHARAAYFCLEIGVPLLIVKSEAALLVGTLRWRVTDVEADLSDVMASAPPLFEYLLE